MPEAALALAAQAGASASAAGAEAAPVSFRASLQDAVAPPWARASVSGLTSGFNSGRGRSGPSASKAFRFQCRRLLRRMHPRRSLRFLGRLYRWRRRFPRNLGFHLGRPQGFFRRVHTRKGRLFRWANSRRHARNDSRWCRGLFGRMDSRGAYRWHSGGPGSTGGFSGGWTPGGKGGFSTPGAGSPGFRPTHRPSKQCNPAASQDTQSAPLLT